MCTVLSIILLTIYLVINAQMRRIDLICKLAGPLFIALVDGISTEVAILVNLGMNVASVVIEYFAIAKVRLTAAIQPLFAVILSSYSKVYYEVPELQNPKTKQQEGALNGTHEQRSRLAQNWGHLQKGIRQSASDFGLYFRHAAFLPSFAGSLLYWTVLSFAGQMVTYLLSAGYNATQVGLARTMSVFFEILATWLAPWLIGKLGPIRAGLWLASWQIVSLVAGIAVFWAFLNRPIISASGLVCGTILSRVGLRGFDLCTQIIIQEVSCPVLLLILYFSSLSNLHNSLDHCRPLSETPTDRFMLHVGRRRRKSWIVLLRRSCLAKCVRALLFRLHHHLFTS
jgi:solute carrier family 40 (iron-regulated transporter), member 1